MREVRVVMRALRERFSRSREEMREFWSVWICWRTRSWAPKPRGMVMGIGEVDVVVSREGGGGFVVRGEILGVCIGWVREY